MITPSLVYGPTAEQVARAIVAAEAYILRMDTGEDEFFKWKSGIRAPVYTDCRTIARDPGAMGIVAKALGSSIRANFPRFDVVVGVAEAGIIWQTAAALDLAKPHAFVRRAMKEHGRGRMVECAPPRGGKAVLVDDLVASGESLDRAIAALRTECEIDVVGVQSIVNWDFIEMRDRFRSLGIRVRALVSFPHLLAAALHAGLISEAAKAELEAFYANPRAHKWNLAALRTGSRSRLAESA